MNEVIEHSIKILIKRVMDYYKKHGYGKDYLRIYGDKELEMGFYIREIPKEESCK